MVLMFFVFLVALNSFNSGEKQIIAQDLKFIKFASVMSWIFFSAGLWLILYSFSIFRKNYEKQKDEEKKIEN